MGKCSLTLPGVQNPGYTASTLPVFFCYLCGMFLKERHLWPEQVHQKTWEAEFPLNELKLIISKLSELLENEVWGL